MNMKGIVLLANEFKFIFALFLNNEVQYTLLNLSRCCEGRIVEEDKSCTYFPRSQRTQDSSCFGGLSNSRNGFALFPDWNLVRQLDRCTTGCISQLVRQRRIRDTNIALRNELGFFAWLEDDAPA